MGLNLKELQDRQAETAGGGGNFFRPKSGKKNMIRIFPFTHEVTKADVQSGQFKKDELGDEVEKLDRPVTLHYNYKGSKKPVISNAQVMKEYQEMDEDKAKEIRPTTKYFLNVVDTDDAESGMKIWGAPKSAYNAILEILLDPEYGGEDDLLGLKGRDFVVTFNKEASPGEMYGVLPRAEGNSEALSKSVLEGIRDLYDPKNLSLFGTVLASRDEEVEAEEEKEEEAPPAKKKTTSDEDLDEFLDGKSKRKNGKK